jgi:hypothetical protein
VIKNRGHFPNEHATIKCVYLAVMSLDPTSQGRNCWTMRWKPALNAPFKIAFEGRLSAARKWPHTDASYTNLFQTLATWTLKHDLGS